MAKNPILLARDSGWSAADKWLIHGTPARLPLEYANSPLCRQAWTTGYADRIRAEGPDARSAIRPAQRQDSL